MKRNSRQLYDCDRCMFTYKKNQLRKQRGMLLCEACFDSVLEIAPLNVKFTSPRSNSTSIAPVTSPTIFALTTTGVTALSRSQIGLREGVRNSYVMYIAGTSNTISSGVDSFVKLMLHCNGVNTSTTFTDSEITPKTVTTNGNTQVSTTQSKFGGASGLFDGSGDYLSLAASTDFDFGTGDFTIDFWFYIAAGLADGSGIISGYTGLGNGWFLSVSSNKVVFTVNSTTYITPSAAMPINAWTHIALVRSGNTGTIYQNGISVGTASFTGLTINTDSAGIVLGRQRTSTNSDYYTGYLDEVRVSKGIARWTSAFTPPSAEYTQPVIVNYISITANPQIVAAQQGTLLTLVGTSDTSYVIVNIGNGTDLTSQMMLKNNNTLSLVYNTTSSLWCETSRS